MQQNIIGNLRPAINLTYLADEHNIVAELIATLTAYIPEQIAGCAKTLVDAVRIKQNQQSPIEAFLQEYQHGVIFFRVTSGYAG